MRTRTPRASRQDITGRPLTNSSQHTRCKHKLKSKTSSFKFSSKMARSSKRLLAGINTRWEHFKVSCCLGRSRASEATWGRRRGRARATSGLRRSTWGGSSRSAQWSGISVSCPRANSLRSSCIFMGRTHLAQICKSLWRTMTLTPRRTWRL